MKISVCAVWAEKEKVIERDNTLALVMNGIEELKLVEMSYLFAPGHLTLAGRDPQQ